MASISANIARRMIAVASPDIPRDELLSIAGLVSADPDAGRAPAISDDAYYALIERAVRDGDHAFPLRYGAAVEPGTFGALGHAMATAPTVRGALERLSRYVLVISDTLEYELRDARGGVAVHLLGRTGGRRGLQLSNECAFAAIVGAMRRVAAGRFAPSQVTFTHAAPPRTRDHERWFGCPVRFSSTANAMHVADRTLAGRTRLADAGLSAYLLAQLDDLRAELGSERTAVQRARAAVADTLCDGVPSKAEVASRLDVSERTLHRRLADEGETFQSVVDDVRLDIARSLLEDDDRPIGEVAFFTGFAGQSAFTRAFRRWTGTTPLAYRQQPTGG